MEILERLWDAVSNAAAAFGVRVERFITSLFGSSNARYLRKLEPKAEAINALEPRYREMSDDELRGQTDEFRRRRLLVVLVHGQQLRMNVVMIQQAPCVARVLTGDHVGRPQCLQCAQGDVAKRWHSRGF